MLHNSLGQHLLQKSFLNISGNPQSDLMPFLYATEAQGLALITYPTSNYQLVTKAYSQIQTLACFDKSSLLKHRHAYLSVYCLWLLSLTAESNGHDRDCMALYRKSQQTPILGCKFLEDRAHSLFILNP